MAAAGLDGGCPDNRGSGPGFGEGIDHDRNTAARLAVGGTSGRSATGTRRGELIPPGRARRREADLQDPVAERYSKRQSTADSLKLYQVIRAVTGAFGPENLRYRSCRLALPILDRATAPPVFEEEFEHLFEAPNTSSTSVASTPNPASTPATAPAPSIGP